MLNFQRNYMANRALDAFFRNWLVFLITLLGVSGVVGAVLMVRSVKYTATASIRLGSEEKTFLEGVAGVNARTPVWVTPAQIQAGRFTDLMRDTMPNGFVDRALKSAQLTRPINIDPAANDERADQLRNGIMITPLSKDVVQISLSWPDRAECAKIVKGLQKEFINQAGIDNTTSTVAAISFMDTQIEDYRKRLQATEAALVAFKKSHGDLMPDSQTALIEQVSALQMQRDTQAITVNDARLKTEALKKRLSQITPYIEGERLINGDAASRTLADLVQQRADLINKERWLPTSSKVKDLDESILRVRREIDARRKADPKRSNDIAQVTEVNNPEYASIEQQLVLADIEQKTQSAQIGVLDQRIASYKAIIARMPADERTLVEKTRDYTILKDQFEDLLKRRETAKLKANVGEVTAKSQYIPLNVIYAESAATAKKKAMTIAGSLVVGVVVGFLLILLREWMDPSLRYETDAVRMLDMPILASLPESSHLRFPVSGRSGAFKRLPSGSAPAIKDRS